MTHIDISKVLPWYVSGFGMGRVNYLSGYRFSQGTYRSLLGKSVSLMATVPDLVWIDSGEFFGPPVVNDLKERFSAPILLLNLDDPTGFRDRSRFASLRSALPYYDYAVTVRKETEREMVMAGVKSVIRVYRAFDEVAHAPFPNRSDVPSLYCSEVAFIGTWMRQEKRDEFIIALLNRDVPVNVWGSRWEKSPYWNRLKKHYRGGALEGRDYVSAIQGSKICLGMLSKGNRDLHTTRSSEVPYAGGLLCAERTSEHLEMYAEGKEAVFWEDAEECAAVCIDLLRDDAKRERIRDAGMRRVRELNVGNEDICTQILNAVFSNNI